MKFKEILHKISSFIRNLFFHFRVRVALDVGKEVSNDNSSTDEDCGKKGD